MGDGVCGVVHRGSGVGVGAWEAGHNPGLAPPPAWLTVASWIGGDRDGNPSVVTEVTAETLRLHRGLAVERHRRSIQELARRLSVSGRHCPAAEALTAWLDARRPLPAHGASLEQRYARDPYRLPPPPPPPPLPAAPPRGTPPRPPARGPPPRPP